MQKMYVSGVLYKMSVFTVVFCIIWALLGIIGWGLFNGHDSVYSVYPMRSRVKIESILICMVGGWFALSAGFRENPFFKYGWRIW